MLGVNVNGVAQTCLLRSKHSAVAIGTSVMGNKRMWRKVRFTLESGHLPLWAVRPLSASSEHSQSDLCETERPPHGGLSEIRSGVSIRLSSCATHNLGGGFKSLWKLMAH